MQPQDNRPDPVEKQDQLSKQQKAVERDDALDNAIADSFPASDPPAMTSHTPSKVDRK